jgi:prepilin signal peptidase PulO-like enzyme (type II secretory pathway)
LGIVIILGSLFSAIIMGNNWSDAVWGLAMGLGLLFAPDDMLKKLREFIR